MKSPLLLMLLAFVVALCAAPSASLAGAADTLVVAALPPGNLNVVINADTTAGGVTKPNRVYLLKQDSGLDTVYWMTAPIGVKGSVKIVGYINPVTKHPPVIAPYIADDNSSIGYFFGPQSGDTLSLKGLYFLGTRTDNLAFTGRFVLPTGDNNVFYFDHCIVENISGAGTPNVFDTWGHQHGSFYITNCEIRNCQDDNPNNPGFAWFGPGVPADTVVFRNNTFFLMGGLILGADGIDCAYLDFQHNTVFISGLAGSFDLNQMNNGKIQNNIFYGVSSASMPTSWGTNAGNWGTGIIVLDSLKATFKTDPYNLTEAGRHVTISHNAYFWPQQTFDEWAKLDAASIPMVRQIFLSTQPGLLTDKTTWPNIVTANNDSTDPGFNATLVALAAGNMATFADTCWHNGGSGKGVRPYVYPLSDPPSLSSTWPNVSPTWATTQGYPVPENLRYSNTAMQTAGTDGKALGDLNWFPEQLVVSVGQEPTMPTKIELGENYPNPFNPSTQIDYVIPSKMQITLKVYDVLGREVATLFSGMREAGSYTTTFSADHFASGMYFLRLTSENQSMTRKMVLMK
jgi:hypothetical protein